MKSATNCQSSPEAPAARRSGKSAALWCLGAANVALLAFLVGRHLPSQQAHAQVNRPSDYLMVPAQVTGVSQGVVFILDTSKGELSAITYNDAGARDDGGTIDVMPKIVLDNVFKAAANQPRIKPR